LKPDLWSICQIQELAYGVVGTAKHKWTATTLQCNTWKLAHV
jgi:hypothetical protein